MHNDPRNTIGGKVAQCLDLIIDHPIAVWDDVGLMNR